MDASRSERRFPVSASSVGVSASTGSAAIGVDSDCDVAHRYKLDMGN